MSPFTFPSFPSIYKTVSKSNNINTFYIFGSILKSTYFTTYYGIRFSTVSLSTNQDVDFEAVSTTKC